METPETEDLNKLRVSILNQVKDLGLDDSQSVDQPSEPPESNRDHY